MITQNHVQLLRNENVAKPHLSEVRIADRLLTWLVAAGVRRAFGVPGGLAHPLFAALEGSNDIELVVTHHEQGAAFMADGSARGAGELAVCVSTAGPGATNMLTGLACAHADGIPLIAITGQAARGSLGRGVSQEGGRQGIDLVGMFAPVTKWSSMVGSPAELDMHVASALRAMNAGRPGPIHLNIPVDLWNCRIPDGPTPVPQPPHILDIDAIERALPLLARSMRIVILAGSGARGAGKLVVRLAEHLDALIVSTPRGKGVVPEDHPRALGVLGFGGSDRATREVYGDCDLILAIGASLNETTTSGFRPELTHGRKLIQVDIDPARIGRSYPVDVGITGDAKTVVRRLLEHCPVASPRIVVRESTTEDAKPPATTPLTPQRWRSELQEVLPHDALVFSDIGGHMLFNLRELTIGEEQDFMLNLGFGSMGHGTVAPIGAAMALKGRRPVIAIVGDTCVGMNGMELHTAVEYDVPVVWIVEDNRMQGITWHGSKVLDGEGMRCAVPRRPLNIGAFARSMGLQVITVDAPNQMADALQRALPGPSLIHVRVDPSVPPPIQERAKSFAGFEGR